MVADNNPSGPTVGWNRLRWQPWLAVVVAIGGVLALALRASLFEASDAGAREIDRPTSAAVLVAILQAPEISPYLAWLALLIIACRLSRDVGAVEKSWPFAKGSSAGGLGVFCISAGFAFAVAASFGWSVRELPAAYQDEYSYLFQARTYLAGRLTAPPPPAAEHFDQMHVLNIDGVFASRYFPGTGLWFAPFVALGVPYVGGWLLHALTAGFLSLAACRVSLVAGIVAGALVGASPGMVLFANTVLSPSPTMLGMALGWWGFQETFLSRRAGPAAMAGAAIGFAFLTRPLTAAALGMPWALAAIWHLRSDDRRLRRAIRVMILTFLPAVVLLGAFNVAMTGSPWQTPHGKWTAVYSPCHAYGFYNRTRGEARPSEKTIRQYDSWAEELTPTRSLEITASRWKRGVWLMAGFVPTVSLGLLALFLCGRLGNAVLLPLSSVLTLSLAYLPFGFEGIFGFSYIAESTPLLLLAGSIALSSVVLGDWRHGRKALAMIWLGLPIIGVGVSLLASLPAAFAPESEFVYPRRQMSARVATEDLLAPGESVLIIYDGRIGDDRHGTWVYNDPFLKGRVLRAWKLDDASSLLEAFPDRFAFESLSRGRGATDFAPLRPAVRRVENEDVH